MTVTLERLQISPASPDRLGAEVRGLDVRELTASSPEVAALREMLYRHRLLVLREQRLDEHSYLAFTRLLGRPQVYFQANYHHPEHPEIFVSSNILENGRKIGVARTGNYWHTDCSFEPKPLPLTSLYPLVFQPGRRGTSYVDMVAVLRSLPQELRGWVDGAMAVHAGQLRYKVQATDIDYSLKELLERINREVPPVRHPALIAHPVTGEQALYINSGFTVGIEGVGYEENSRRLASLFEFIERPEHVHTHYWEIGDVIIWDNRTLIHRSTLGGADEQTKSYRIGIYDGLPFYRGLQP